MMKKDSTLRFSNRVSDYIKYRPHYPAAAISALLEISEADSQSIIADIGAGTGMLTKALLPRAARVLAVEPNEQMRAACDQQLREHPNYQSVCGSAEATGLEDHS